MIGYAYTTEALAACPDLGHPTSAQPEMTPADQKLGKGDWRRLYGFRRSRVAGPGRFGGCPVLKSKNLAHQNERFMPDGLATVQMPIHAEANACHSRLPIRSDAPLRGEETGQKHNNVTKR
jgi:hypothetical protein